MRYNEILHYFCNMKNLKQIKYPTMKQIILSLALVFGTTLIACTQTKVKEDKTATTTANEASTGQVIQMNKAMFLEKVFNYETNPDKWSFLGDKPAIIDFYADWCGPCKKVAPIMSELATQYKDDIVIYKIDTDKEKELAQVFQIRSIPSILYIPKEGQPTMTMGALPKAEFEKMIKELLLAKPVSQN